MKIKFLSVILILSVFFAGCKKDEPQPQIWMTVGTVQNPNSVANFVLKADNGNSVQITETDFPNYRPANGKRIIAYFTILSEDTVQKTLDVHLVDVYDILTKDILPMTAAMEDSIGNDLIQINSMHIGGHHLNVDFTYWGYNQAHYINLVRDSADYETKTDTVFLEFRHNSKNDIPTYSKFGLASFNLTELKDFTDNPDSVAVVVQTVEYNNPSPKKYNFTYKFNE